LYHKNLEDLKLKMDKLLRKENGLLIRMGIRLKWLEMPKGKKSLRFRKVFFI
jgi:hypothetical protein